MKKAYVAKDCIKLASTFIAAAEEIEGVLSQARMCGQDYLGGHTRCQLELQQKRALVIVSELMNIAGNDAENAVAYELQALLNRMKPPGSALHDCAAIHESEAESKPQ